MNDLQSEIERALVAGTSLNELVEILRNHHTRGLGRQEARDTLEQMRSALPEEQEDQILEMLDVVTGFCQPHLRVW